MKGSSIVHAVMQEKMVGREDFFTSQFPEFVWIRRVAIRRLHKAGLNKNEIGRVMQRDPTTIGYWLRPEMRARKKVMRPKYYPGAKPVGEVAGASA